MTRYTFRLKLGALFYVMLLALPAAASESTPGFQVVGRVDSRSLAHAVASPTIYAFDLSPTGRTLALLVRSGDNAEDIPTWLLVVDSKSGEILRKVETGNLAPYWTQTSYILPQVLFTPDGKYLVLQELGEVRIVDTATLRTTGTVEGPKGTVPVSVCGSAGSDLIAVSFAKNWQRKSQLEKLPVYVEMIDVPDAIPHGGWDSVDPPQALSPDGKLAAVSDWSVPGPLLKLAVIDTSSGRKLATLDGGFEFKKPWRGRIMGRIAGRFLSSKQIVLSPDGSWDRSGHYSGDSLRIVDSHDGKIVQELKPRRFGPTGEIRIAGGGREIVTASWYLPPSFYTHPHERMPLASAPGLLVYLKDGRFRLEANIGSLGGGSQIPGSALPFQVSSDGSVIAAAQRFGVTIFERAGH